MMKRTCLTVPLLAVAMLALMTITQTTFANPQAAAVLEAAGNPGGLAVVLDAGDGDLVTSLAQTDAPLIVEGLETDPAKVAAAQAALSKNGLAGRATVRLWDGETLPYVDNTVRLLVVGGDAKIDEEIARILCPGGKWVSIDTQGKITLGGSRGRHARRQDRRLDALSQGCLGQRRVARQADRPPAQDAVARRTALVTKPSQACEYFECRDQRRPDLLYHGRRPRGEHVDSGALVAGGAGRLQWRITLDKAVHDLAQPDARLPKRSGPPAPAARRRQDKDGNACVFAKPGFDQPIEILDAATGKVIHSLKSTEQAEEIIHEDGVLLTVLGDPTSVSRSLAAKRRGKEAQDEEPESVAAFDTATGKQVWKKPLGKTGFIASLTLSADKNDRVFVQNERELYCLDLKTGETKWTAEQPGKAASGATGPVLVATEGEVLLGDGKSFNVFDIETGEKLWSVGRGAGFRSPTDVLVQGGLVWLGPEFAQGLDLRTGEVQETTIKTTDVRTVGHHHRCYRQKATERYLLEGYRGIEFYDIEKGEHSRHNWVRGTCQYGIMPANGLMYAPPHACGCFMEAKLRGFWALATDEEEVKFENLSGADRLTKGPAYGAKATAAKAAWPTLRGGAERAGITEAKLPGELAEAWETNLGGLVTAPIVADGKVFVAKTDDQEIVALDANSGRVLWTFSARGSNRFASHMA